MLFLSFQSESECEIAKGLCLFVRLERERDTSIYNNVNTEKRRAAECRWVWQWISPGPLFAARGPPKLNNYGFVLESYALRNEVGSQYTHVMGLLNSVKWIQSVCL